LTQNSNKILTTLVNALESIKDPVTGCQVIKKVWRAEYLYKTEEPPNWNILVLEPAYGYSVRNGDLSLPVFWPQKPNQDYLIGTHTETGLWAFSSQETSCTRDLHAHVCDLAPTILSYLGLPIPKRMEGTILPVFHTRNNNG